MVDLRFGLGFDVHRRDEARALLLGAAGLGDLGGYFPDSDPGLAGIAGADLLRQAMSLVRDAGFDPDHCDLTVGAERPAVSGRRDEIRRVLGEAIGLEAGRGSVKATRPEGLGLSGDGAACLAVAVVRVRT